MRYVEKKVVVEVERRMKRGVRKGERRGVRKRVGRRGERKGVKGGGAEDWVPPSMGQLAPWHSEVSRKRGGGEKKIKHHTLSTPLITLGNMKIKSTLPPPPQQPPISA